MEQLAVLARLIGVAVVGCIGYTMFNFVGWVFGLFGGLCIGCAG